MSGTGPRFGYVPYTDDLTSPADRRRFLFWARERGIDWEVHRPGARYDVVVLAGTADIVRWARAGDVAGKLVYELIDSYLEVPGRGVKNRLRGAAKFVSGELSRPVVDYHAAVEAICHRADAVVCATPEQRARLLTLNPNVHAILDAHLDLAHRHKTDYRRRDVVNLAWEGQPYTLDDFEVLAPTLRRLAEQRPLALHLVTDLTYHRYARRYRTVRTEELARRIVPETYLYEWNPHLLADVLSACDLALIPLDLDDPLAAAKPENKLLLLWRLGLPVITSATPAYRRVMAEAGLDLVCATPAEWEEQLVRLIDDEEERRRAGTTGRDYVTRAHSREAILERWDALYASLLGSAP